MSFVAESDRSREHGCNRLFIVGTKGTSKEAYQDAFDKFGEIKNVFLLRDKRTGDDKGMAYITFSKASEAALALEEMNGKSLESSNRRMKIMIASDRNKASGPGKDEVKEEERMLRLFIVVPRTYEDADVKEAFQEFGDIDHVKVMKDKNSGENKGFGFVRFRRPYHAALAVENCDPSYQARFAEPRVTPRDKAKQQSYEMDSRYEQGGRSGGYSGYGGGHGNGGLMDNPRASMFRGEMRSGPANPSSLIVQTNNTIGERDIAALFDVAPGLVQCEMDQRTGIAYVKYESPQTSAYARTKLNGFPYPPGFQLVVEFDEGQNQQGGNMSGIQESVQAILQNSSGDGGNIIETILKASDLIQRAGITRKTRGGGARDEMPMKRGRFSNQY